MGQIAREFGPWQVFQALSNVSWLGQDPSLDWNTFSTQAGSSFICTHKARLERSPIYKHLTVWLILKLQRKRLITMPQ
jgi:hypothetical protein